MNRTDAIPGDGSDFAPRATLAAREQDKYEELHGALMGMARRSEEASVIQVAEQVGLDVAQPRRDMQSPEIDTHIAASMAGRPSRSAMRSCPA